MVDELEKWDRNSPNTLTDGDLGHTVTNADLGQDTGELSEAELEILREQVNNIVTK